jgi:hypothetical protein
LATWRPSDLLLEGRGDLREPVLIGVKTDIQQNIYRLISSHTENARLFSEDQPVNTLAALPRGKSPRYPLDKRLDGSQSQSGRRGDEKIIDSAGTRIPTLQSSSP